MNTELKIYCNICGEVMTEIVKHHIEEHDLEEVVIV